MFNAKVKSLDKKYTKVTVMVFTETLYEAECYLRALFSTWYDSRHIKLIHEHDLIYKVFDNDVLICELHIRIGDEYAQRNKV